MTLDPYASCPCGSGKKFKWCCQPIYSGIQRAWDLHNNEQLEAASRQMDEVVKEHGNNPEAWGQRALLYFAHKKDEEGENALEKAFAINPNYPFGLNLRAKLRHGEGEFMGALLLARKAVDVYDPDARDALTELESLIFDCEMRCNRPVAARAALARLLRLSPGEDQFRQTFEQLFGPKGRYPNSAKKAYEFRKVEAASNAARRDAWNQALARADKLSEAARAFEELTQQDPGDAAAWFNLGLTRAWLGDNQSALTALNRYLELEQDQSAAVEAAALSEVLRFGYGMEDQCDYNEYSFTFQLSAPQPVEQLLRDWSDQRRLVPTPTEEKGLFMAMLLEYSSVGLVTVGRPASEIGHVAGHFVIVGNLFRFASSIKDRFDRVKDELRQKLSLGLTDLREQRGLAQFADVVTEALTINLSVKNEEEQVTSVTEQAAQFFEQTWIHRPLKSLSNVAPIDAVGHSKLRYKVLGLIQFIEDCAANGVLSGYSFDGVRRKLGLLDAPPSSDSASRGVMAMSAAELAALQPSSLDEDQLAKAYQSAYRLDAQELAGRFAVELVGRPPSSSSSDRYPWFSFLIQKALRDGEKDQALDHVNEGEKFDCEHNQGKRRNEYELYRAQVHGKRGEVEEAQNVFQRLIERVPRDFKVRGKAAETMMTLKEPARALKFAEDGVNAARQANDRDSEQYLLELVDAARRQGG